MRLAPALVWCGIATVALILRLVSLETRPMHNDEGLNALKFGALLERGEFRYDPHEYHGPTLYYLTLPFASLTGAATLKETGEDTLRWVTVFFGVAVVLLPLLLIDGLGRCATAGAAALTAVSPAMVFYSRYYIHEMLLVAFTLLFLGASWRWWMTQRWGWALAAGAAIGLMHATKETFIFSLVALAGALTVEWGLNRFGRDAAKRLLARLKPAHLLSAGGVALVVSILLFTSFFSNASGPVDSIRTYLPWFTRAAGETPHVHPWNFYLERLVWFRREGGPVWTELTILLLAVVGFISSLRGRAPGSGNAAFVRLIGFYTLLLTGIYSVIPYKTPWCLLGFLSGLILLAGVGVAMAWQWCRRPAARAGLGIVLLIAAGHLAWEAMSLARKHASDRLNPYVYAQTSPDLLELVERVRELGDVSAGGDDMLIKVMVSEGDYWPLPWYLREFNRAGWWAKIPDDPNAEVVITNPRLASGLPEGFKQSHFMAGYFSLRPQVFLELHVETNLWEEFMASRAGAGR